MDVGHLAQRHGPRAFTQHSGKLSFVGQQIGGGGLFNHASADLLCHYKQGNQIGVMLAFRYHDVVAGPQARPCIAFFRRPYLATRWSAHPDNIIRAHRAQSACHMLTRRSYGRLTIALAGSCCGGHCLVPGNRNPGCRQYQLLLQGGGRAIQIGRPGGEGRKKQRKALLSNCGTELFWDNGRCALWLTRRITCHFLAKS